MGLKPLRACSDHPVLVLGTNDMHLSSGVAGFTDSLDILRYLVNI